MRNLCWIFVLSLMVKVAVAQSMQRSLDSIATKDVPPGAPGIASFVIVDGRVTYEKYAGYANLENKSLLDENSRFNIASNGKQFTALAILKLAEEKKLNLEDDIRKYFPGLYKNFLPGITIENLLTHSSGIRDVYDLWSLQGITWWKETLKNRDAVGLLFAQHETNLAPGTEYLYSNSNYILLAEIVAKVSGESFRSYTDKLFKALGMTATSFEDNHEVIRGPIAHPYFNFDKWTPYKWLSDIVGDGCLFSTLKDQIRWERLLQKPALAGKLEKILNRSQELSSIPLVRQYGYGLEFGTYKGIAYRFHEGATGAWKATALRFPGKRLSIVTLTNSGKTIPYDQTREMADIMLGLSAASAAYLIQPLAPGKFVSEKDLTGVYQTAGDFTFRFEMRDTSLYLLRSGRNDIRLVREADNIFHQWNDPAFKQEFLRDSVAGMTVTAYYTSHAPYSLKRVDADWTDFDFKKLNGRYRNDETKAELQLEFQSNFIYKAKLGSQERVAILITPGKFIMDNYVIEISPDMGSGGNELFLSGGRIKRVRFSRF